MRRTAGGKNGYTLLCGTAGYTSKTILAAAADEYKKRWEMLFCYSSPSGIIVGQLDQIFIAFHGPVAYCGGSRAHNLSVVRL